MQKRCIVITFSIFNNLQLEFSKYACYNTIEARMCRGEGVRIESLYLRLAWKFQSWHSLPNKSRDFAFGQYSRNLFKGPRATAVYENHHAPTTSNICPKFKRKELRNLYKILFSTHHICSSYREYIL